MTFEKRSKEAVEAIEKWISELTSIVVEGLRYGSPEVARQKLRYWNARTFQLLSQYVNRSEAEEFTRAAVDMPSSVDDKEYLEGYLKAHQTFLRALAGEVEKHPECVLLGEGAADGARRSGQLDPHGRRQVFIIHGRDEANVLRLEKLLEKRWNLSAIVMRWEAGKGRTLIEKFEDEADPAGFALALLTPDDLVKVGETEYAQARPNVVFELGWFCGKLGRQGVCILLKEGTRIHSDLDGISRIEFRDSVEERIVDIERELKEAKLLGEAQASP